MGQLRIMNRDGDKTLTWEPGTVDAEKVRAEFNTIITHSMAYSFTSGDSRPVMTRQFDETAEKIVVTPRVAGG